MLPPPRTPPAIPAGLGPAALWFELCARRVRYPLRLLPAWPSRVREEVVDDDRAREEQMLFSMQACGASSLAAAGFGPACGANALAG